MRVRRLLTSSLLLLLGMLAIGSVVLSGERMAGPTLGCFPGFHKPEETGRLNQNSSNSSDRKAAKDMIHFILEPRPSWWRNCRKVSRALFWHCAQEVSIKGNKKNKTGLKFHKNPLHCRKSNFGVASTASFSH